MKRVLLTGGTGFVGANLTRRLLAEGHSVHLAVRAGHQSWRVEQIRPHVEFHLVDLADAAATRKMMETVRPDWIFHLAAHGAYSWQTDAGEIFRTNLTSTLSLVEAALGVGFDAFIHTGSSSEYGLKDHAPVEDEWIDPNSTYAVAKASATLFCRFIAQRHQANLITLRLYSAYGPYEDPNRLIPKLIERGLKGGWPLLVNPATARDYVYVDDICEACLAAAQAPVTEYGLVYNVGSGRQTTLAEVVEVARKILSIPSEPVWNTMPPRDWDTSVWVADNALIREKLGWQPRRNFEEGFRETVNWTKQRDG